MVNLHEVSKSYGPLEILKKTNGSIERGDKIALIGANGKGKSTLLRILAGTEPIEGERVIGYNVIYGFYAQHQLEALHVDSEILEELKQAGSKKTEQELRGILGCFLFSDEDVFKRIKVLSAEKNPGLPWQRPSFQKPTSCCWTSLPTTSISSRRIS